MEKPLTQSIDMGARADLKRAAGAFGKLKAELEQLKARIASCPTCGGGNGGVSASATIDAKLDALTEAVVRSQEATASAAVEREQSFEARISIKKKHVVRGSLTAGLVGLVFALSQLQVLSFGAPPAPALPGPTPGLVEFESHKWLVLLPDAGTEASVRAGVLEGQGWVRLQPLVAPTPPPQFDAATLERLRALSVSLEAEAGALRDRFGSLVLQAERATLDAHVDRFNDLRAAIEAVNTAIEQLQPTGP